MSKGPASVEQLCNIAAVIGTGAFGDVLEQLVGLALAQAEEPLRLEDLLPWLRSHYWVAASAGEIEAAAASLQSQDRVFVDEDGTLVLHSADRDRIQNECAKEAELEHRVRVEWFAELVGDCLELDCDHLWAALEDFMQSAFARHGSQTVLLLLPGFEVPPSYERSLSELLAMATAEHFSESQQATATHLISKFFRDAGSLGDRTHYINRLADAAVAFFLVHVPPEVSSTLTAGLSPMTVFVDTNFLFAFLGLHADPFVDLSDRLVAVVAGHQLPLKLRYHESTAKELARSLSHHQGQLNARKWPQALSRAAVRTGTVSGIELRYHEKNARSPIAVDDFFKPFKHSDVLLRERGVEIFRVGDQDASESAAIAAEYSRYLAGLERDRTAHQVEHDADMLATVRRIRGAATTSLDGGALIITCDYVLFGFDRMQARISGEPLATVLPDLFWQVIRPYIPSTAEYSRAFADTFALPQFRTIESHSGAAASRMLSLLAAYEDVPEETAVRMLSNELLLDQLSGVKESSDFEALVEAAFVNVNSELVEENEALSERLASREAELESKNALLAREQEEKAAEQRRRLALEEKAAALDSEVASTRGELGKVSEALTNATTQVASSAEEMSALSQERDATAAERDAAIKRARRQAVTNAAVTCILLELILAIVFFIVKWPNVIVLHQRATALEWSLMLGAGFATFGAYVEEWRVWCWGTGLFFVLVTVLQLL